MVMLRIGLSWRGRGSSGVRIRGIIGCEWRCGIGMKGLVVGGGRGPRRCVEHNVVFVGTVSC